MPSDEEDARITAAALADPDSPLLTKGHKMRLLREGRPDLCAALVKWSSGKSEKDAPAKSVKARPKIRADEAGAAPVPASA